MAQPRVVLIDDQHGQQKRGKVNESLAEPFALAQLVGEDPAFMEVKRKILLIARCEAPVLLSGETGTGKEVCARALHYASRRAGKPFLESVSTAATGSLQGLVGSDFNRVHKKLH